ncbi:MAG: hypothetical protein KGP27_08835 [Hyphomicrobiales bacterium]|nr:hypothetical protein [Hyphomicrobiales bacterium]
MHLKILSLISFGAALVMSAHGLHANPASERTDLFAGATVISAVRTELGTPRLDAVSRTLDIDGAGYRIREASLGRVLCGKVEVSQAGNAPLIVSAGEPLSVAPGTVVRALEPSTRIVVVSVIPRFDAIVP